MEDVRANTLAGVAAVICGLSPGVGASTITEEDLLRDDRLGLDSLTLVEFVLRVEKKFDVTIRDAEVGKLRTVGDVVNYVLNWYADL